MYIFTSPYCEVILYGTFNVLSGISNHCDVSKSSKFSEILYCKPIPYKFKCIFAFVL